MKNSGQGNVTMTHLISLYTHTHTHNMYYIYGLIWPPQGNMADLTGQTKKPISCLARGHVPMRYALSIYVTIEPSPYSAPSGYTGSFDRVRMTSPAYPSGNTYRYPPPLLMKERRFLALR